MCDSGSQTVLSSAALAVAFAESLSDQELVQVGTFLSTLGRDMVVIGQARLSERVREFLATQNILGT